MLWKVSSLLSLISVLRECLSNADVCCPQPPGPAFNYLDAPIVRVSGADVPMPYAKSLEQNALPQGHNIVESVKKVLHLQQSASVRN